MTHSLTSVVYSGRHTARSSLYAAAVGGVAGGLGLLFVGDTFL